MPAKSVCGKLLSPNWHSGELCDEYQILLNPYAHSLLALPVWDRVLALIYLTTMFFALRGPCGTTDFRSRKPHSSSWASLEIFIRNSGGCSLTDGAGKVDTAASRSWLIMRQMEFRRVRPAVGILINHGTLSTLLPVCCRKESGKGRKSPENSARKPLNPMKSI